MSDNNVIAIDLAKSSFQVCVVNAALHYGNAYRPSPLLHG